MSGPAFEVGDRIGPERRRGPLPAAVRTYADEHDTREALFVDRAVAERLGYRDVIVPGPMQAAFLEQMIRRHFRGWQLERLSTTFRISVIAGDPIVLRGVITEVHHASDPPWVVCEVMIESSEGERTTTAQATLRAAPALST